MNRISVKDVSRELQMSPLTLRTLMRLGRINIGFFTKKPDAKRGHYVIYRRLLEIEKERLGIE